MLAITGELRCLVCQNQTIADSHADLAVDLRQQVREMLQRGQTPDQIRRYMTDRYGDFILYRPPLKATHGRAVAGRRPRCWPIALVALAVVIRRRSRLADDQFEPEPLLDDDAPDAVRDAARPPRNARMTLFVILSLALVAATLAILVWRGPVVAHVTDPATAAAAVTRPTRGLVIGLALLIARGGRRRLRLGRLAAPAAGDARRAARARARRPTPRWP